MILFPALETHKRIYGMEERIVATATMYEAERELTHRLQNRLADTPDKPALSNSRITTFLACRQLYKWIYVEKLATKEKSIPLQVGDITHQLLDLFFSHQLTTDIIGQLGPIVGKLYPDNDEHLSADIAYQAAKLFNTFVKKHNNEKMQIHSPEMHLEKDFGPFSLYARLDGLLLDENGGVWREEFKTTSRTDSAYLSGLRGGLQTGISIWLLDELFPFRVKGTCFDLLVKKTVSEALRSLAPRQRWVVEFSKQTVHGVARSIARGDFYPSMNCIRYNRPCEYMVLCQSDTPQNRSAFFTERKEASDRVSIRDLIKQQFKDGVAKEIAAQQSNQEES